MKGVATFGPNFGITDTNIWGYIWEGVDISNCKNINDFDTAETGKGSTIYNAIWDKNVSKVKDENGDWTQEIEWEYINSADTALWNKGKEYHYFTAKKDGKLVLFNEETNKWEEYRGTGTDKEQKGKYAYELNKYVISKLEGFMVLMMV